jgi:hypothetical protein
MAMPLAAFLRRNDPARTANNSERNLCHESENQDAQTLLKSAYINISVTFCALAVAIWAAGYSEQQVLVVNSNGDVPTVPCCTGV